MDQNDICDGLFIEGGMCIVNTESISQRIKQTTSDEEREFINTESVKFLSTIVSLCHGREALKLLPSFDALGKTLIQIFKHSEFMTVSSGGGGGGGGDEDNDAATASTTRGSNGGSDNCLVREMSLDVIKSMFSSSSAETINNLIRSVIKVLAGYNPFKLKENMYIVMCDAGKKKKCICTKGHIENIVALHVRTNPVLVLSQVLQLFCHKTIDVEKHSKDETLIQIPLKLILLNMIDVYSPNTGSQPRQYIDSFDAHGIHSHNTGWTDLIQNRIAGMPLEYRFFTMLIYCALLYLPCCRADQTFKLANLYIETILLKMCYNAAETLSCASLNNTSEKDNGNFISYMNSYAVSNVLSSTIRIEKAISNIHNKQYLRDVFRILTNNNHIISEMDNVAIKEKLLKEMERIFTNSTFLKSQYPRVSTSDVRSVRNIELFKILGEINTKNSNIQVVFNNSIINHHSNGNNIRVNNFHILSMLPRAEKLSSEKNSQCYIENYFDQEDKEKFSLGNFAGWWMGIIDGAIGENGKTIKARQLDKNSSSNIMRLVLSNTIKEVYKNRYLSFKLLSYSHLPDNKVIANNGQGLIVSSSRVEAQESQRLCVFSSLQTPDIIGANCSILAPMQIEIALTRPKSWIQFVTKIMYFIERFNVDCYREFLKMMSEPLDEKDENRSRLIEKLPQMFGQGTMSDENVKHISTLLHKAFDVVKCQYVEGSYASSQFPDYKMGEKRLSLFEEVYNILRDIILTHNQNPRAYLTHSRLLLSIYSEIDDFLIDALKIKGCTKTFTNVVPVTSGDDYDDYGDADHIRKRLRVKREEDRGYDEDMDIS
uniref:Wsv332-like protein n=1 Tax=Litopenaeus vannamei majanivirus Nimav-1_LVa TaxID=2984273 RepID=A0A9C7EYA0_9VIRU|nr:MAG: wsv332-like protein [Litopenaeus vannamei majanivirus Nimav-1_LVa]